MLELVKWWYGRGWQLMFRASLSRLSRLNDVFSVDILLRTLFAPWRRIVTYPGAGIDAHLRAMLDNFVSRCVGFVVRISVLFVVFVLAVLQVGIGIAQVLIWPLFPLLSLAAVVWGLS